MHTIDTGENSVAPRVARTASQIFDKQLQTSRRQTDRMFAWLMAIQWLGGIMAAVLISPKAWEGLSYQTHIHVWAAIFLGGIISGFPIVLAWRHPGQTYTRHVIAVAQMLTSALLIHLSGGRIETHFHVFGSLAFLAFYQDWRVLVSATIVVAIDHAVRGIFWPESVFGVLTASPWRWVEHAAWVIFEDIFLLISIRNSLRAMFGVAERQAKLEGINEVIERTVVERTAELSQEIIERKRAEQQLSLEYTVSRVMGESGSIQHSGQKILELMCQSLHQNVGLLWMVDQREGLLRCAEIWRRDGMGAEEFCAESRALTFGKGLGLPGRVWANGQPIFIPAVADDLGFVRAQAAGRAGLLGGFGFPIVGANGINGVMEFFCRETKEPEPGLLRTCGIIGGELGRAIEHKRVQEHLFQSQKMEMVGKMAGGIAHEFNSILTAVIGQSEILLVDLPPNSPSRQSAREIGKAANRAAGLTRQLLAYGRKQMLLPQILNVNEVLEGMTQTLRHLAGRDIDLRIVPCRTLYMTKADAGQVEQVILNIVMNAADAMPNGGKLTLETANVMLDADYTRQFPDLKAGAYIMLAITDTGTGMSDETKQRAFDPFFTTKEVGKGTGLGLATCHGIVKQSGGHIAIYSEFGRGTSVKVYLPRIEEIPKDLMTASPPSELPCGTETILMVEDDPALREMASALLKRLGYRVLTASNGIEALNATNGRETGHIDLLFTDVVMPQMSGKELSDRVRSLHPQTKILFTSAFTENAITHQGVLDPGVILLPKPFAPAALAQKVREVLDQSEGTSSPATN